MANQEQLSILRQGVEVWNKWRWENFNLKIDLSDANLTHADLNRVHLSFSDLSVGDLQEACLIGADLRETNLRHANFAGADLSEANLGLADLWGADLHGANLSYANLSRANLSYANLNQSNLKKAVLFQANLNEADLVKCNLSKAEMSATILGNLDLSETIGLEEVDLGGPCIIGTSTLVLSKGRIPDLFLRGCGFSDWEIKEANLYNRDLSNEEINKILYKIYDLRATQALQLFPLFVSYSHADRAFVDKVETQLNDKGIRYWRDIHDMKAGRIEKQIDRAITQDRTVLLVLSEHSLKSDWVEHEVRTARGLEKDMGRDVLCPIALDDSWKSSPWPKRVMEQIMEYNILDFSAWKDDSKFEDMFRKLIDGLELFYKG